MLLTNDFVIIARDVTTDANDSMATIYKIIDNFIFDFRGEDFKKAFGVEVGTNPVLLPASYMLASSWSLDKITDKDYSFTVKASLHDSSDLLLTENSQEVTITKGMDRIRFNMGVQGLPVKESGRYTYKMQAVDSKGKTLASGSSFINVELKVIKDL